MIALDLILYYLAFSMNLLLGGHYLRLSSSKKQDCFSDVLAFNGDDGV